MQIHAQLTSASWLGRLTPQPRSHYYEYNFSLNFGKNQNGGNEARDVLRPGSRACKLLSTTAGLVKTETRDEKEFILLNPSLT